MLIEAEPTYSVYATVKSQAEVNAPVALVNIRRAQAVVLVRDRDDEVAK